MKKEYPKWLYGPTGSKLVQDEDAHRAAEREGFRWETPNVVGVVPEVQQGEGEPKAAKARKKEK